jgi:hypothetical protein
MTDNGAAPPSDRLVNAEMALEALANVIKHNRGSFFLSQNVIHVTLETETET